MICYGVADVGGSYGFGYVIKYVGRIPCFLIASVFNYTAMGLMIFYQPTEDNFYVLFIIAILWGLGDAVYDISSCYLLVYLNVYFLNLFFILFN